MNQIEPVLSSQTVTRGYQGSMKERQLGGPNLQSHNIAQRSSRGQDRSMARPAKMGKTCCKRSLVVSCGYDPLPRTTSASEKNWLVALPHPIFGGTKLLSAMPTTIWMGIRNPHQAPPQPTIWPLSRVSAQAEGSLLHGGILPLVTWQLMASGSPEYSWHWQIFHVLQPKRNFESWYLPLRSRTPSNLFQSETRKCSVSGCMHELRSQVCATEQDVSQYVSRI